MSMLSDVDLRAALESGELVVDPIDPAQIQPASIDLRLDNLFRVPPQPHPIFPDYVDPLSPPTQEWPLHKVEWGAVEAGAQFVIPPNERALANTIETVTLGAALSADVAGKSSIGRHFLAVHVTAGFVDPGFSGQITLELFNHNPEPFFLTPGMRICQIKVHRLITPARNLYGSRAAGSHYQGQRGPTLSRAHLTGGGSWRARTRNSRSSSAASSATSASPPSGAAPHTTPSTTPSTSTDATC